VIATIAAKVEVIVSVRTRKRSKESKNILHLLKKARSTLTIVGMSTE
jgi:hypothetical protein